MQPSAKVEELLQVLRDRGMNDAAVESVKDGLWTQASEEFMQELIATFTAADVETIEAAANQEEANAALRRIFQEKSGKDMDEEIRLVVDQQATELIKKYKVEDTTPVISESFDKQSPDDPSGDTGHNAQEKKEEETIHDLT
jgi:hypothetical protein